MIVFYILLFDFILSLLISGYRLPHAFAVSRGFPPPFLRPRKQFVFALWVSGFGSLVGSCSPLTATARGFLAGRRDFSRVKVRSASAATGAPSLADDGTRRSSACLSRTSVSRLARHLVWLLSMLLYSRRSFRRWAGCRRLAFV